MIHGVPGAREHAHQPAREQRIVFGDEDPHCLCAGRASKMSSQDHHARQYTARPRIGKARLPAPLCVHIAVTRPQFLTSS
ncbi:MAG: hypothetical protein ABI886_06985 [Betaproteobacteria bacterium]